MAEALGAIYVPSSHQWKWTLSKITDVHLYPVDTPTLEMRARKQSIAR